MLQRMDAVQGGRLDSDGVVGFDVSGTEGHVYARNGAEVLPDLVRSGA